MSRDLPRLVPDSSGADVLVKAALWHRCPHVDEVDVGTVEIGWTCGEMTIELHALAAYLHSWEGVVISHEALTAEIIADLEQLDGIEAVQVATHWTTAGMEVDVSL